MSGASPASFTLSIRTPEKSLFEGNAQMVMLPGIEGDLGVLPRHMAIITQLRAGQITVHKTNHEHVSFQISSGYAHFGQNEGKIVVKLPAPLEGIKS